MQFKKEDIGVMNENSTEWSIIVEEGIAHWQIRCFEHLGPYYNP